MWRGVLADTDARWDVVAAAVDDRTAAEEGRPGSSAPDARMAGSGVAALARSRYSSISRYAFECDAGGQVSRFCDVDAPVDEGALERLLAAGVDGALARHVAGLFARDPLVLFAGMVEELDDETRTDHFDNLQSTNWNTVRLKPPDGLDRAVGEPEAPGWRTEFRPMEIQLTDFENAAFAVFTVLVTRVILAFDLSLYVPLSRVDANMRRAHRRDAVNAERFYFRTQLAPDEATPGSEFRNCCDSEDDGVFEELTCAEIIDGKGDYFPGLAPLAYAYLDHIGCDSATLARISDYIELVRAKANGGAKTPATWIRDFVANHPDYKGDSVLSPKIARDLAVAAHEVGVGARPAPDLTGGVDIRPVSPEGAWDVRLKAKNVPTKSERAALLAKYAKRAPFRPREENYRFKRDPFVAPSEGALF